MTRDNDAQQGTALNADGHDAQGQAVARPLDDLRLAASVFMHGPQAVMIIDGDHKILKVNPAFTQITGWRESDVLGRRDNMLSAGRDAPGLGDEIQAVLDRDGIWVGELWSRRADG